MATKHTDPLDAWLERVEALPQWQMKVPGLGHIVTSYLINGQLAVVIRYKENLGWELLVPSSNKNNTAASLDGAAMALGVDGCRGLVEAS